MLSIASARELAAAGIMWDPQPGDAFAIDEEQLTGEIFWVSELTIEVHHYQDQTVLGFNGTTEWALDSVPLDAALWLPREDQLRLLIGDRFVSLTREGASWTVEVMSAGLVSRHTAADPEDAYAAGLLHIAG